MESKDYMSGNDTRTWKSSDPLDLEVVRSLEEENELEVTEDRILILLDIECFRSFLSSSWKLV